MRTSAGLWVVVGVFALNLGGCAASSQTQTEAQTPPPVLEPTAVAVEIPELALAEQTSWPENEDAAADVEAALSSEPALSKRGVEALRRRGQAGLDALLAALGERAAREPEARAVVTRVAQQLDAHASGLFWYTDRDAALAAAKKANKPVLSLRLLGRLDDELSCANSRFFRTAVYPNADLSAFLRESFVLHWSSERPAPRITIDYGDGRKLERTITGNSLHYVLAPDGQVIDALPGLYGAAAFKQALRGSYQRAMVPAGTPQVIRATELRGWHAQARRDTRARWRAELAAFGLAPSLPAATGKAPSAAEAAPVAMTKMTVEAPMVAAVLPSAAELAKQTDDATWRQLAIRNLDLARLDGVSRAVIRDKQPMVGTKDGARQLRGSDLERLFLTLELRMAEDTLKNELMLHERIHGWLESQPLDFEALNRRVYAELFLTPRSDPWLGLLPANSFTGIRKDGVTEARKRP